MTRTSIPSTRGIAIGVATASVLAFGNARLAANQPAAAVTVPPAEQQIASAVLAAPEERRADAEVLGYATAGAGITLKVLRAGTNDIVCLADEPGDDKWSVACYHRSLEPFMKRGRELEAEGISGDDRMKRRWAEADAGTLAMPKAPATLYVLSGKGFDAASGKAIDPYLRYVVYTPYATQESTGLPLSPPGPGGPWIMFPGTAGAHIMITPPKEPAAASVAPATPAKPAAPVTPPAGKDPRRR